ncbi:unnamed protein product, partial [Mesorhabditis belari]|uniref:Uncharacterized protein n=1 Tax=Mesorhabditis belari TaxID=2138241 RepID=A0AAF3FRU9_9BILA
MQRALELRKNNSVESERIPIIQPLLGESGAISTTISTITPRSHLLHLPRHISEQLGGSALSSSLSILPDKTSGGAGLTMGGNGRMLVKGHTVTMGTPRQL